MVPASRITILTSPAASTRLDAAADFLRRNLSLPMAGEMLLVGQTREAADDLARGVAMEIDATFGLHRLGLRELARRVAEVDLARRGLAHATGLASEAVATHAAFEEQTSKRLNYLHPIAQFRSFGRTLAATLHDLRHADVDVAAARASGGSVSDIARLARRYAELTDSARLVDDAALYRAAAAVARGGGAGMTGVPLDGALLLLDVAVPDEAEFDFVAAVAGRAATVLATVPAGDARTLAALRRLPDAEVIETAAREDPTDEPPARDALDRVRRYLFGSQDPPPADAGSDAGALTFSSAPGESRETVEIARAIIQEAERGVPFDEMAVVLRSPAVYAGLLETALDRASVPAWFSRGTRVPHPAGRAFLALLNCALENLSARRFSEYLSLGQVPLLDRDGAPAGDRAPWTLPDSASELTPTLAQPSLFDVMDGAASANPRDTGSTGGGKDDNDDSPVVAGGLRAPYRWDKLLVESAVVGGRDRWERRLDGLAEERTLRLAELRNEEPESPRIGQLEHSIRNLDHLRRFALPVIERLAAWPQTALWGEWLDHFDVLAPMVLKDPSGVLAILADLRPMASVGPAPLSDVRDVLMERLTDLQRQPPRRRYGRVFVGGPDQVRGRRFRVVFIPGLAERVFPQKHRQDPLLLDRHRAALNYPANGKTAPGASRLGLLSRHDRNQQEKLLLQAAIGAATERIWVSYPRLEVGKARPRVPSFYALDLERARTGRIPDFRQLERRASEEVRARLAWPAPPDPARAIDDAEHDLAVLSKLLKQPAGGIAGRARYLLHLNGGLHRSLISRYARWQHGWSRHDGLYGVSDETRAMLARHRLSARAYSCSGLQRFALCPYQFLLGSVARIQPLEEIQSPIEQLDPLTRGSLYHAVQAEFTRAMTKEGALPVTRERLELADTRIDGALNRVAEEYKDKLVPAIERVWNDEIEAIRIDLKGWIRHVADEGGTWIPLHSEFGFGLPAHPDRDPASVADPVTLEGRWNLRGVVDQIEAKAGPSETGALRVTDFKTGKDRTKGGMVVNGGQTLQPVLYGLAVEQALGRPVSESQLFFATATGRYQHRVVRLEADERRKGIEVLEVIDRAVKEGELVPAPLEGACKWCDYLPVCGPWEERRVQVKNVRVLADLRAMRSLP